MRYELDEELRRLKILVVDDEAANVQAIERLLARAGYRQVYGTTDGLEAMVRFRDEAPDLVLLDLRMPFMDGFELMKALRERVPAGTYLPILVLTGDLDPMTRERALGVGATDFVTKPFEATETLLRIRNLLETRHLHLRLARHNVELEEKVRERTRELDEAQVEILFRLALAAEYRDDVTGRHAERVGALSSLIARELGMAEDDCELLRRAAPLHDVGKIGIPDAILLKRGSLTPPEFEVMRSHVAIGARILGGSRFDLLQLAREIALSHHERWDGSGYVGLKGKEIPLPGRIVAVADVFDSLTHERPYKPALPVQETVEAILVGRGRQFDPDVVDAFVRIVQKDLIRHAGLLEAAGPPEGPSADEELREQPA